MRVKYFLYAIFIILLVPFIYADSLQYGVSLELQSDGGINLEKITLLSGNFGRDFLKGAYLLRVLDVQGNTLYRDKFDFIGGVPPKEWFDEQGKQIFRQRRALKPSAEAYVVQRVTLMVPYFENAYVLQVYNPEGRLVLSYPLDKLCMQNNCLSMVAAAKPVQKRSFFSRLFG